MSWREKMAVGISRAEDLLHIDLIKLGLTKGMYRNIPIVLEPTSNGRARGSRPDYVWPDIGLAVFLDGPVHDTRGGRLRDELVAEELRQMGIEVRRYPYRPPISLKRRREISFDLEGVLNGAIPRDL